MLPPVFDGSSAAYASLIKPKTNLIAPALSPLFAGNSAGIVSATPRAVWTERADNERFESLETKVVKDELALEDLVIR